MQPLQHRAARVVATTQRAWRVSVQPRRPGAGLPRLRFVLPRVRGFFFAI